MTLANKHKIAQGFSQAAPLYDSHALLQRRVRERLYQWLPEPAGTVLDAGSGPGQVARDHPNLHIISLDVAHGMSIQAAAFGDAITADMEKLPLATASISTVFSSLAAQWLPHQSPFWQDAARISKPKGVLLVATLVEGTLDALKIAYERANLSHTGVEFLPESTFQQSLVDAGWEIAEFTSQTLTTSHASVKSLLQHFKEIGASASAQSRSIRHRGDIQALETHYPTRLADGRIQANWRVAFIMAKKPTQGKN